MKQFGSLSVAARSITHASRPDPTFLENNVVHIKPNRTERLDIHWGSLKPEFVPSAIDHEA